MQGAVPGHVSRCGCWADNSGGGGGGECGGGKGGNGGIGMCGACVLKLSIINTK